MERRGVEKGEGREGKREGGEYFEIEGRVSRNEGYGVGEKDEMIKRVNVWGPALSNTTTTFMRFLRKNLNCKYDCCLHIF